MPSRSDGRWCPHIRLYQSYLLVVVSSLHISPYLEFTVISSAYVTLATHVPWAYTAEALAFSHSDYDTNLMSTPTPFLISQVVLVLRLLANCTIPAFSGAGTMKISCPLSGRRRCSIGPWHNLALPPYK